jgi:hypothetical protein
MVIQLPETTAADHSHVGSFVVTDTAKLPPASATEALDVGASAKLQAARPVCVTVTV